MKPLLQKLFLFLCVGWAWAHGGHYLPATGPGATDFKPARAFPSVELRTHENKALVFPPKGPAVVLFGYTQCPDACPLTLGRLLPAYEALGSPANLHLMLLSVDERDTPQTLQKYLRGFSPVQGLTGKPEAIRQIAEAAKVEYNLAPGGRLVFHTDAMALLDAEGRLVRMLYGVSRLSTAKLKDEVSRLLR
ncbi:SCO family protein [Meiothermus sp.]|uniref:SCO family protein n=1 Tax=Meiothermus sp. TaxID=1955249 RepID=UPI00307E4D8D